MKIAMIISTPFPPEEGIGFHVYNLSKNLIKRGHEISVITRGDLKYENYYFEDINVIKAPFLPLYPFHVRVHGLFISRLMKSLENEFDIIHFHNPLVPFIKTELPTVATLHGSIVEHVDSMELIDLKSFFSKILGKTISYNITKNIMKSSDEVLTISKSVAEQIKEYYNFDKFEIIYNGVDVNRFYPSKSKENYLLYVGRLGHGKGIFDLLDAFKLLNNESNIKLLMAGKGELEEKILSKIKNENICNVELLGHVGQEDLVKFYQNALIFVFPSHYEGLPTAILEAMASGLPIVTTSVSGCKDLINDKYNGLLVPSNNPHKLYEAILHLINNPDFREYLGKNARLSAEKEYSWNILSEKVEIKYKSLM